MTEKHVTAYKLTINSAKYQDSLAKFRKTLKGTLTHQEVNYLEERFMITYAKQNYSEIMNQKKEEVACKECTSLEICVDCMENE